jgi:hypothetical protein
MSFHDYRQSAADALDLCTSDGSEVYPILDRIIFEPLITKRMKEGYTRLEAEVWFADVRRKAEIRLFNLMRGQLDVETAKNIVRRYTGED